MPTYIMKIAGRKNAGAWYRTNKFIKDATDDERAALQNALGANIGVSATSTTDIAFNIIKAVNGGIVPKSGADDLTENLVLTGWVDTGIPYDFFMGKLSYDIYEHVQPGDKATLRTSYPGMPAEPTNTTGAVKYVPINAAAAQWLGGVIRQRCRDFMFSTRKVADLINRTTQHNPGGIADATKGT